MTAAAASAREVATRYVELVNAGDLGALMALFARDATVLHPLGRFAGHDAIRSFYAERILPEAFQLLAVSVLEEGPSCVFELEARIATGMTCAIDHLTVGVDGLVHRLAIYYRSAGASDHDGVPVAQPKPPRSSTCSPPSSVAW